MRDIIKVISSKALCLIGISLISTSFLIGIAEAEGPKSKGPHIKKERDCIKITNMRDTTFNVSWVTHRPQTCQINYGTDPGNLNNVSYDDRGSGTVDDTHYVTIKDLSPNTVYYFDVISGGKLFNKKGKHLTCTTGPTLSLPDSKTVYGQVFKRDGANADGAIVYVTIKDEEGTGSSGSSAEMSCLVSSGYFYINLGGARTEGLNEYFDYSSSGDSLNLFAQGAGDGTDTKLIDTGIPMPIPAMRFKGKRP